MDKQTMMLELKGLSRVIDHDVRRLVHQHIVLSELADDYEPVNPFLEPLDQAHWDLQDSLLRSMHCNLSESECAAFKAQWQAMGPTKQHEFLVRYVEEGVT